MVTSAAASKRYRVTISGPGGHSYRTFGMVNPAHALGNVISSFTSLPVPEDPKTTYNIGRIGGGRSVNAIPDSVWDGGRHAIYQQRGAKPAGGCIFIDCTVGKVEAENLFRSPSNTKLDYETLLIGALRPSGEYL
ncbi:MAG: peptidase dimerization domain-containing protein [Porticoccaceae bacterium]